MKDKKERVMKQDIVRFLTINLESRIKPVLKHMVSGPGRIYIDLERRRVHIPGKSSYQFKHLDVNWNDTELLDNKAAFVVHFASTNEVVFATEIWRATFMSDFDKGRNIVLIDIDTLHYYIGGNKWKKI